MKYSVYELIDEVVPLYIATTEADQWEVELRKEDHIPSNVTEDVVLENENSI